MIMVLCCVAIGIIKFSKSDRSIFWPETIAVATFAAAWLVNGQTILKDKASATASR